MPCAQRLSLPRRADAARSVDMCTYAARAACLWRLKRCQIMIATVRTHALQAVDLAYTVGGQAGSDCSGLRGLKDLVLEPATTRLRTCFMWTAEPLDVRPRGRLFLKKVDRASNAQGLRVPEAPSYADFTDTQSPGLMTCSFQVTCTILPVVSATTSTVAALESLRTRRPFAIVSNWQEQRSNSQLARGRRPQRLWGRF